MYSVKEKLSHFRQLSNQTAAEADLQLLTERAPVNSNLIRYGLSPTKNAEDILFDLLDVCTHDEIVRYRRDFFAEQQTDTNPPTDTENVSGNGAPAGSNDTSAEVLDNELPDDTIDTSDKKQDTEPPTDTENVSGNGTPDGSNDTQPEVLDNELPDDTIDTSDKNQDTNPPTDTENVSGNDISAKPKPKKSSTPKKKKKNTPK